MPARPVIVNNTPLVALWVLDRLDLLRDLYGEVLIPQAVYSEFLAAAPFVRQVALDSAPWVKAVLLTEPQRVKAYTGLDLGEAEVLALAAERNARLVIIDERKGRRYALHLGLPLTGTLGLLLLAKEAQLITSITPLIDELLKSGLFLDAKLIDRILQMAGESPSSA